MSFETKTCVVIVCDGGSSCDPWDEGKPHFDTEAEAVEYVRARGWLVTDGRALCGVCVADETCRLTGHVWDDWYDISRDGVKIRQRSCDQCQVLDWDPPYEVLYPKFQALRDAEDILREVGRAGEPG